MFNPRAQALTNAYRYERKYRQRRREGDEIYDGIVRQNYRPSHLHRHHHFHNLVTNMKKMKIELTEKEYNTIDDILYEFAHHSKKGGAYYGYGIYNIQSQQEFNEIYELWLKVAKARYIR